VGGPPRQDTHTHEPGCAVVAAVEHGDGRPFHDFDPADPVARHLCGADDYAVRYDFADWPCWRAEWTVRGPRKDYRMVSAYAPVSAGSKG
jgi:hypothetical protein